MNRIQLVILNEQIYSYLLSETDNFLDISEKQKELVDFSSRVISEIDNNNDLDLKTVEDKFKEFNKIDNEIYVYLEENIDNIIERFQNTLLSISSYKRLPKLLVSAYVSFVVVSHFEKSKSKLYMNEMIEISKMYLELKFIKMLNSMMDEYAS